MPSNLAQARRNYYGGNTNNAAAEMDSGTMYYNANGSRTGARIDGRVKRKTMMGGASQGPISMRANRSETMEKEAEAEMDRRRQKGIARAQAEAAQTARPANGYGWHVPVGGAGKPAGYWKDGRSAGSQEYVPGSPPAPADKSAQDTTPGQLALIAARKKKGQEGVQFSRRRAAIERSVANSTGGGSMNWRRPTKEGQGELADLRDRGSADIWFGNEKF